MFEKVTKFRMLPSRRPTSDVIVPANDNRRVVLHDAARRARAPRLICRWSLAEDTNRPTCRWELDSADEPKRSLQRAQLLEQGVHKTVLQLSYLRKPLAAAARTDLASDKRASSRTMMRQTKQSAVLHARH
jgi:hypothetical protein